MDLGEKKKKKDLNAANKLEIELELTRDSAEKLVGFKEEYSEAKVFN